MSLTKLKKPKINSFDWRVAVLFFPGIIYLLIFTFYPLAKIVVMSFFDWQIGFNQTSPFVGFANYVEVFQDPIAIRAFINTLVYALVTVPLQMIIGLLIAVLINGIKKFSVFLRLGYYLPVITSWVVVALLFRYIFSNAGMLNYILTDVLHIVDEPIGWLSTRWNALSAAMLLGVWKGIGWNMVIFLASLQAVPKEYYEVADISGYNKFQQFFKVTLPSIKGTILFAIVMLMIGAFNTYTPIAVLTGGNPAHQTDVILTWMYFNVFDTVGNMGYSAALSVMLSIVIVIFTVFTFRLIKREDS
jgi:multiple sugar transport system permease protein